MHEYFQQGGVACHVAREDEDGEDALGDLAVFVLGRHFATQDHQEALEAANRHARRLTLA